MSAETSVSFSNISGLPEKTPKRSEPIKPTDVYEIFRSHSIRDNSMLLNSEKRAQQEAIRAEAQKALLDPNTQKAEATLQVLQLQSENLSKTEPFSAFTPSDIALLQRLSIPVENALDAHASKFITKDLSMEMNRYLKLIQIALQRAQSIDVKTGLRTPLSVDQVQNLLQSMLTIKEKAANKRVIFDQNELQETILRAQKYLAAAKNTAESYLQKEKTPSAAQTLEALARVKSVIETSVQKFTQETDEKLRDLLTQLQIAFESTVSNAQEKALFQQELAAARKLIAEKKWETLYFGSPIELRKNIYAQYEYKKESAGERLAREWLKTALEALNEVVKQQKEAFLQSWDTLWKPFENAQGQITPPSFIDIDEVFHENGCGFSAKSLRVDEILKSAAEAHNVTDKLLQELKNDGKAAFMALQEPGRARPPYGNVRIDTTPPLLAVKLICDDPRDYTLMSEHEDSASISTSMGVSFTRKQVFSLPNKIMYAPLVVVNTAAHKSQAELGKTTTHEIAHRKIMVEGTSGPTVLASERETTIDDIVIPIEIGMPTEQIKWLQELSSQYKTGLTKLRNEVQAYTEELHYDFKVIEKILLQTGPNADYEYVASKDWVDDCIKEIKKNQPPLAAIELITTLKKDVKTMKTAYVQRVKNSLDYAEKIANLFPRDSAGRAKAGVILRFSTIREWRHLVGYLT